MRIKENKNKIYHWMYKINCCCIFDDWSIKELQPEKQKTNIRVIMIAI